MGPLGAVRSLVACWSSSTYNYSVVARRFVAAFYLHITYITAIFYPIISIATDVTYSFNEFSATPRVTASPLTSSHCGFHIATFPLDVLSPSHSFPCMLSRILTTAIGFVLCVSAFPEALPAFPY